MLMAASDSFSVQGAPGQAPGKAAAVSIEKVSSPGDLQTLAPGGRRSTSSTGCWLAM
jgi:hypothetical protein